MNLTTAYRGTSLRLLHLRVGDESWSPARVSGLQPSPTDFPETASAASTCHHEFRNGAGMDRFRWFCCAGRCEGHRFPGSRHRKEAHSAPLFNALPCIQQPERQESTTEPQSRVRMSSRAGQQGKVSVRSRRRRDRMGLSRTLQNAVGRLTVQTYAVWHCLVVWPVLAMHTSNDLVPYLQKPELLLLAKAAPLPSSIHGVTFSTCNSSS